MSKNESPVSRNEGRGLVLFGFIAIWWLALCWTYSPAWPRPFDDWKNGIFYMGAGLLTCCFLWRRRPVPERIFKTPTAVPLLCFLVYGFAVGLSIVYAPSAPYEGLLEAARLLLWIALAWCFSRLDETRRKGIVRLSVLSAAAIALTILFEAFGFKIWPHAGVWMGPIGHVSYFGDFMALHLPLGVFLLTADSDRRLKSLWGLCLLLILAGLWLSGTRASMVGVVAGLFFTLVVLIKIINFRWQKALAMLGIFIGVGLAMNLVLPKGPRGADVLDRIKSTLNLYTQSAIDLDEIASGRGHIYANTARMIRERPLLGWGLGSFRFNYPEFDHRSGRDADVSSTTWLMHSHNEILNQWAEVGLPGLLAFLFFFGFLYVEGLRQIRLGREKTVNLNILTALGGLTIALTSWQLSTNFLFPLSRLLAAFYAGILWREIRFRDVPSGGISIRKSSLILIGIISLCTIFLGAYHFSLYASMRG